MPVVFLLSIPGLRAADVAAMPNLSKLAAQGGQASLTPSFPCVTWPVQANMLTGSLPSEHGVIANGFYWREQREVEMWTASNQKIQQPQLWDVLKQRDPKLKSAAWFPMLSKGCGADYICMPAPVHNPDGSESLWCYTRPVELYGQLRDKFNHFPLQHFWGPIANIKSTAWIVDSAVEAATRFRPHLFYIYLPHLDYAAQKHGPDSPQTAAAVAELDETLGRLLTGVEAAYGQSPLWLAASEYTITPVEHVSYPNRVLREAELLVVREEGQGSAAAGELIDFENSRAWALVDHQFSHVFVRDADPATIEAVCKLFRGHEGIAEVLAGSERIRYQMDHQRSGEVILISTSNSWQAYYYWLDDARAPSFARTVDIHRKPGYDPVELFFDPQTRGIPLDATLVRGSHGAPANEPSQRGVIIASKPGVLGESALRDTDVSNVVLKQFAI
ncbi:MAG: alkaline phosphatase family protein [Planctomycetes bacterium]|nr:alkaline phosphatase family protein [Planctomycetota bacterium]